VSNSVNNLNIYLKYYLTCLKKFHLDRLKELPLLKMVLNRVILVVTDGLNKVLCVGAHLFAKEVIRLVRKSDFLFTTLYLNVLCHCNKFMPRKTGFLLPFPVSLTRSGYPKIIPSFHRNKVGKMRRPTY